MTATDVTGVGPAGPVDDPPMSGDLTEALLAGAHRADPFTPPYRLAPSVVASLAGELRDGSTKPSHAAGGKRVRHDLDLDALERVLKRAGFAVTRHGRTGLMEASRAVPGMTVSVLITPRRAHQYVVYRPFVDGAELPMILQSGMYRDGQWCWHTPRSAVRRALAEVHLRRADGAR